MWGLAVVVSLYLYVRLAMWVIKKLENKRESKQWKWGIRVGVTLVFVLIPAGDAIVGHLYLNHLCSTEAGVKVYQTVELPAEYWDGQGRPMFFNKYGRLDHKLMENKLDGLGGRIERYSIFFPIDKNIYPIKEKSSQKLLAEVITFGFWGGWVSRNFSLHNTAVSCEFMDAPNFHRNFYGKLFKPTTSTR